METIFKGLISVILVLSLGILSACSTTEGFGKDLQRAGESLQKAAKDNGYKG
jgi:predicted small secreted protein